MTKALPGKIIIRQSTVIFDSLCSGPWSMIRFNQKKNIKSKSKQKNEERPPKSEVMKFVQKKKIYICYNPHNAT